MSNHGRSIRFATIVITAMITLMSVGCTSGTNDSPPTEYELANRQISEGNYNAAIATMSARLQDRPQDQKARVILASAYSARAGIFMGEYFEVINRLLKHMAASDAIIDNQYSKLFVRWQSQVKDQDQKGILDVFSKVYVATFRIGELVTALDMIPRLSADNQRDVALAVETLNGADAPVRGGAALYSGLLRLLLLKNNLASKYDLAYLNKCNVDLNALASQLTDLQNDVQGLLLNLANGFADRRKAASMKKASENIESAFGEAISTIQQFSAFQEVDVTDLSAKLGGKCAP
jgi:hypothetical protein